jgi:hypothetical protein
MMLLGFDAWMRPLSPPHDTPGSLEGVLAALFLLLAAAFWLGHLQLLEPYIILSRVSDRF